MVGYYIGTHYHDSYAFRDRPAVRGEEVSMFKWLNKQGF